MKHKKTIMIPMIPEHTQTVTVFETCDLCGDKIESEPYEVNHVEVRHKKGENYPDCGEGIITFFDICGSCFEQKLVPWLISQGAKPQVEEWDW
jgi:hypothetical protein